MADIACQERDDDEQEKTQHDTIASPRYLHGIHQGWGRGVVAIRLRKLL